MKTSVFRRDASIILPSRLPKSCMIRKRCCWRKKTVAENVQVLEIDKQPFYRWKAKYGGMKSEEAQELEL